MLGPMSTLGSCRYRRGFTLVETLVVVALAAVILALAAPSLYDLILVQRLKGINAQLVTDLQFGRSEAVSRNRLMRFAFDSTAEMSCYSIYILKPLGNTASRCDCTRAPGTACTASDTTEVRTVQVPASQGIRILTRKDIDTAQSAGCATSANTSFDPAFAFDHITGGLYAIPKDQPSAPMGEFVLCATIAADAQTAPRALRTAISPAGRPTVCQTRPNLGATPC